MSNNAYHSADQRVTQGMSAYEFGFTYGSQSDFGTDTDTYGTDEQDAVSKLYRICHENFPKDDTQDKELHESQKQIRKATLEHAWSLIRRWFKKNPNPDDRRKAACYQGHFSRTALHLCCNCPGTPVDIIADLIDCFPQTVQWPDNQGWLPLHHACAYGLSGVVLSLLCDSYPDGKLIQDKKGRTPLHFLFYRKDQDEDTYDVEGDGSQVKMTMRSLVDLLADTGAYSIPDYSGLIPMHYACAYGTSNSVLTALLRYDPTGIHASEKNSRTPIHYAMSNAQQASSSIVLDFLLSVGGKEILNKRDKDQNLPIHLLVSASRSCPDIDRRNNVIECVKVFLSSAPKVDAEMFSCIQSLPTWLRDHAVIHPHMQHVLSRKVSKPFNSCMTVLDLICHCSLIIAFEISTFYCIRFQDDKRKLGSAHVSYIMPINYLINCLMVSLIWFLFRKGLQILCLLTLGKIASFFSDLNNYFDLTIYLSIIYSIIIIPTASENYPFGKWFMPYDFMTFIDIVCIFKFLYYSNFIKFISIFLKTFAVFASGVKYVLIQLWTFLVMLFLVLVMFSSVFTFLMYLSPPYAEPSSTFPNFSFSDSLLKMLSMMMGEMSSFIKLSAYKVDAPLNNTVYEIFTVLYAIFVVIVLSNMLIAITTDSYGFIKNERAVMVFFSNRLDQVAENDAVLALARRVFRFEKTKEVQLLGQTTVQERPGKSGEVIQGQNSTQRHSGMELRLYNIWDGMLEVFKDDAGVTSSSYCSCDFFFLTLTRMIVLILIPLWLIFGLVSMTFFWPPQIREAMFGQETISTPNNSTDDVLWDEFDSFKESLSVAQKRLKEDMKIDRAEIDELNFEVYDVQKNVIEDIVQVKEIMNSLLESMKNQLERKEMQSRIN